MEKRAGRMKMIGHMVHPEREKGSLYVYQADNGLIHFCWKSLITHKVERDLIIIPNSWEFKRVEQCKTGQVYLLKVNIRMLNMLIAIQIRRFTFKLLYFCGFSCI